jgi:hypothetical protein
MPISDASISSQAVGPVWTIVGTARAMLWSESNSNWRSPLAAGNGTVRSVMRVKIASVPSEAASKRARSIWLSRQTPAML